MDAQLVDITVNEESDARKRFRGSNFQKVLHNDCVKRLAGLRIELENSGLPEFQRIQGKIQEIKSVLELIHAGDSEEIKKIYGR